MGEEQRILNLNLKIKYKEIKYKRAEQFRGKSKSLFFREMRVREEETASINICIKTSKICKNCI